MSMNNQGRPTSVEPTRRAPIAPGTVTPEELNTDFRRPRPGCMEEALIFEIWCHTDTTVVRFHLPR